MEGEFLISTFSRINLCALFWFNYYLILTVIEDTSVHCLSTLVTVIPPAAPKDEAFIFTLPCLSWYIWTYWAVNVL